MKFLILNYMIRDYSGSEINAMQLCKALIDRGHTAEIGTFILGDPLKSTIEKTGIPVINLLDTQAKEFYYDVVWAHHSPTLSHLLFKKTVSDCKILFSSLSLLIPLEAPPSYHQDIELFLSYSENNTKTMLENGVAEEKISLFLNFAPKEFYRTIAPKQLERPKKIGIISNHIPQELQAFTRLASDNGYLVDQIGLQGTPRMIDPAALEAYDLVISIGKTVIYCFAMGKPVYCYDHFGGPGYITPSNFRLAQKNNFSGRGFDRKLTAEQLLNDIELNFSSAISNLEYLQEECRRSHDLETNLTGVLEKVKALPLTRIEEFKSRHSLDERLYDIISYVNVSEHETQVEHLKKKVGELEVEAIHQREQFAHLLDEVCALMDSKSWKITRPLRWLRRLFDRRGHHAD